MPYLAPSALFLLAAFSALVASGRVRPDLLAVAALLLGVAGGAVPAEDAFAGLGHPVLPALASLFVIGTALRNSGAIDAVVAGLRVLSRWNTARMLAMSGVGAVLAALVGNGPVLASIVHAALQGVRQQREQIGSIRLPITVLAILGGLFTVVGTVPNLLATALFPGRFGFGDFAAVGGPVFVGAVLVLVATWRLLPRAAGSLRPGGLAQNESYLSEVLLPAGTPLVGQTVRALELRHDGALAVKGIVREEFRRIEPRPGWVLEAGDVLVLACEPAVLQRLLERAGLSIVGGARPGSADGERVGVVEAIVAPGSPLVGSSAGASDMARRGLSLLAVGRSGREPAGRLHRAKLQAGDVLMLQGELAAMPGTLSGLGCLTLSERRLQFGRRQLMWAPVATLLVALSLAGLGTVSLPFALVGAALALVLLRSVTPDEAYAAIPWPLLVLLGALLPLVLAVRDGTEVAGLLHGAAPVLAALPGFVLPVLLLAAALGMAPLLGPAVAPLLLLALVPALAAAGAVRPESLATAVALGASCHFVRRQSTNMLRLPVVSEGQKEAWRVLAPLYATILLVGSAAILHAWPPR